MLKRTLVRTLSIAAAAAGTLPMLANAAGEVKDFTIQQHFTSPRAMGMGGAFVGLADDYNALFYNPAGLARLEEGQINLAAVNAAADPQLLDLQKDIDEASKTGDVNDLVNVLEKNYGEFYQARISALNAFWARPKWAIAFIPMDVNIDIGIHRLATLDLIATQDSTLAYGRGWDVKWGGGRWSLGMTAKAIHRVYYNKAFLASELALDQNVFRKEDATEGLALDADFGLLYSPKTSNNAWFKPTFGMTVRNIVDAGFLTNFHMIDPNSGKPPKLGRRFDLGSSVLLPTFWVFTPRFLADLRDMGHQNFTFKKGSHAGVELEWKVRNWLRGGYRAGLHQGYFTTGLTLKGGIFNLDVATYAEDLGPSDNPKPNRRYMARASLDW